MNKSLGTGHVPSYDIIWAIEEALGIEGPWEDSDERLQPLTRIWNIDDLKVQLGVGRKPKWVDFDLADQVICALGRVDFWRNELEHIYLSVRLKDKSTFRGRKAARGSRRCARTGCSNIFVPRKGGHPQRFCSPVCKYTHHSAERRGSRSRENRRYDTCPAGHDRSPENSRVVQHKSGQVEIRCKICERARKTS